MITQTTVRSAKDDSLSDFLSQHGFEIESLGDEIIAARRADELPVLIKQSAGVLYFETDLGNVKEIASEKLYFSILDLNTEILPVAIGINSANPDDPRLVLVESRVVGDLCDYELLSVFDAMELATDRVEELLRPYLAK